MPKPTDRSSIEEWCGYCKDEIFADENYIVIKGCHYHVFCWKQKNTYIDPFDDTESNEQ